MLLRFGVSTILIGQVISTWIWKYSVAHLKTHFLISAIVICLWFCLVIYLNNLSPEYTISYILTLFIIPTIVPEKKWVIPFILVNLAISSVAILLVQEPEIDKIFLLIAIVFFSCVLLITLAYHSRIFQREGKQKLFYQEMTRAAFETTRDGIIVVDMKRRVLETNQKFREIWKEDQEYSGKDGIALGRAHADARVSDPEAFLATEDFAHENPEETTQDRFQLTDGRIFDRYSQPLITKEGISGRFWYITDITDRIAYEMELEKNLSLIKEIFNSSEMGIVVFDEAGNIKTYNENFLKIWEIDPNALETVPLPELMYSCFQKTVDPEAEMAYRLKMQKGEVDPPYRNLRFKNGKLVERSTSKLVYNVEDFGQVWFYRDITEREKQHEILKRRNHELDNFIYRASHDLKAPLNSIMGLTMVAGTESEPAETRKYLDLIYSSTIKLEAFTRNLSDFSFIEREIPRWQRIDLAGVIDHVVENHRYLYGDNGVDISVNINQSSPLTTDHARVLIILSNLISNGIKFFDKEKEKRLVRIDARVSANELEVVVEDNGIGISKEDLPQVEDMFFRASNQSFGSGMGLYIVKNALNQIEGAFRIDSDRGKGTKAIVTIPNHGKKMPLD